MSVLESLSATPLPQVVGLALFHFSWQGLLIGAVVFVALAVQRDRSPNGRYVTCLVGMVVMLVAPALTTYAILSGTSAPWSGVARGALIAGAGASAPAWLMPLLPWLSRFWLLGASLLQVRLLVNWLLAERMKRSGALPAPSELQGCLAELRGRMGITRVVRLVESTLASGPSVIGWIGPVILLPVGIATNLTPAQLRAVIAHELAHIQRHDYLVNLLQNVFESLLFFHPVTWWISDRLRGEREFCCDDIAVSVCDSALQYAQALSCLEDLRTPKAQMALASQGGSLMSRLARITSSGNAPPAGMGQWLAPVVVMAGMAAIVTLIMVGCSTETESLGSGDHLQIRIGAGGHGLTPDARGLPELPDPETLTTGLESLEGDDLEEALRARIAALNPGGEVHVACITSGEHVGAHIICVTQARRLPGTEED